ncbi:hypothetical protein BS47DRAFT_1488637 [Hydnum rufescens UP504]|uniref:Uncharacterized protein n=1 Tax=Hydnum rufescens UP504 TaxID=1448309 RepID=A0A9P6ALF4_9AGAM|nr:hypothetical protein BS47DRAFT_1488637 [Hydnum rufescens UP504]
MPTPVVAIPTTVPSYPSSSSIAPKRNASDVLLSDLRTAHNHLKDIDILAPCSRPPSPASQFRIDEMEIVIKDALQSSPQSIPHLLDLASTRLLGPHPNHPSNWGHIDHAGSSQSRIFPLANNELQWNLWVSAGEAPPPLSAGDAQKHLDYLSCPLDRIPADSDAPESAPVPRSKRPRVEQSVAGPSNRVSGPTTPRPRTSSPSSAPSTLSIESPSQAGEFPLDFDLYVDVPPDFFSQSIVTSTPVKGPSILSSLSVTPQGPPLRLGSWRRSSSQDEEQDAVPMPAISQEEYQKHMDHLRSVPAIDLATLSAKRKIRRPPGSTNTQVTPTHTPTQVTSPHDPNSELISLMSLSQTSDLTPPRRAGPKGGSFEDALFNSQYDVDLTMDGILQFISDDLA